MKFTKLCLMFTAATLAVGAFADAANVLVSFSTEADFYADGDKVADGEWYALCWSPRETFGGLTLNCTPVNHDEEVVILAPLAKDGRCPSVVFQVDSKEAPIGGYYFVYVLDTRVAVGEGDPAPAEAVTSADGRRVPATTMNGAQVATKGFSAAASVGSSVASTESAGVGASWSAVQPKITAFAVNAGKVNITVTGVLPGMDYKVRMGKTLDALETYTYSAPKSGTGKVEFKELNPGDAKFFSVVGE